MLAYAANRPAVVDRRPHPNTMLAIIGAHVALIAALMSAKMDLPIRALDPPTEVELIRVPPDPAPNVPVTRPMPKPSTDAAIDQPIEAVPMPVAGPTVDPGPAIDPGPIAGGGVTVIAEIPQIDPLPVKSGPQLITPESQRKPPYPASKLLNEEEAVLTLRLAIDERGRVVAVEPVGHADSAFLESARRHLIAHWRYKPAMEGERAVSSSMVIRLRFELDG